MNLGKKYKISKMLINYLFSGHIDQKKSLFIFTKRLFLEVEIRINIPKKVRLLYF